MTRAMNKEGMDKGLNRKVMITSPLFLSCHTSCHRGGGRARIENREKVKRRMCNTPAFSIITQKSNYLCVTFWAEVSFPIVLLGLNTQRNLT